MSFSISLNQCNLRKLGSEDERNKYIIITGVPFCFVFVFKNICFLISWKCHLSLPSGLMGSVVVVVQ